MAGYSLVDRIYECVFDRKTLESTLAVIAKSVEAACATLAVVEDGDYSTIQGSSWRVLASTGHRDELGLVCDSNQVEPRLQLSQRADAVATILDPEDVSLAREFQFMGSSPDNVTLRVTNLIDEKDAVRLVLDLRRRSVDGPFTAEQIERLNELGSHFVSASRISLRVQREQARGSAEALAVVNLPAIVFDASGEILAVNSLVENLNDVVLRLPRSKFALRDALANTSLQRALVVLNSDVDKTELVDAFPVRNQRGALRFIAHVVSSKTHSEMFFARAAAVIILAPIAPAAAPSMDLLRSVFGMTGGEARTAYGLAQGISVEQLSNNLGMSVNTVRTYVRRVLEKTGTRRQSDAILLLAGLALGRNPHGAGLHSAEIAPINTRNHVKADQ